MSYVWIIDDKLAVSPLPSLSDINGLSKVFSSVVVLIEPHELPTVGIGVYLDTWLSNGVEVYYAPTPDFHPVDLLELYCISRWINEAISRGGRVLIHCRGGIGRSGMAATAYLLFTGTDLYGALNHVRQRRPGAVEAAGQFKVVEDYAALLRRIDKGLFNKHVDFLRRNLDPAGWRHASKTLQLTIELHQHLDVEVAEEAIYASLYHCLSNELLEKALNTGLISEELLRTIRSNDPVALIVRLAHTLDLHKDSRVVYTESSRESGVVKIELFCENNCLRIVNAAKTLLKSLEEKLGARLELKWRPYGEPYF